MKIINVEKQLDIKEFDIQKLKSELQEKETAMNYLIQTFEQEYETLRKENERNVMELQRTYKENIEKSRPPPSNKTAFNLSDNQNEVNTDGASSTQESASTSYQFRKPPIPPSSSFLL